MFSQKREIPIKCDSYIDLYSGCPVGCEMCKFNLDKTKIVKTVVDYDKFNTEKVLLCYSTDPYAFDDFSLVKHTIEKLHDNECKIVFLTRKANCLMQQLDLFGEEDIVGISLSENNSKNSNLLDAIEVYKKAKELKLKTWMSLEPVLSSDYANYIIEKTKKWVDYYRVGKDDLERYNWKKVKCGILQENNIYVK